MHRVIAYFLVLKAEELAVYAITIPGYRYRIVEERHAKQVVKLVAMWRS
jgi:hypothetical protein